MPHLEARLADLVEETRGLQPWRRVVHAVSGVMIVLAILILLPDRTWHLGILLAAAAVLLLIDVLRLRSPRVNLLLLTAFRPLASPRELARPASSTWYVVGIALTVWLYPLDVALTAVLVLALADPAASVVGRLWGHRPLGIGSWEGTLAFLVVASPLFALQAGPVGGVVTGLVTAGAEVAPLRLDDNLVVPLVGGASLLLWGSAFG